MALQRKDACEMRGHNLGHGDEAYTCSYECTFRRDCSGARQQICPNCGEESLRRPLRKSAAAC